MLKDVYSDIQNYTQQYLIFQSHNILKHISSHNIQKTIKHNILRIAQQYINMYKAILKCTHNIEKQLLKGQKEFHFEYSQCFPV